MRLFIAVNTDDKAKQLIHAVQDRIRKEAKQGKYPPAENFHITLVFLGEIQQNRIPEIKQAIIHTFSDNGKPHPAFNLVFSKAGFFKRGNKELWWLGMDPEKTDPAAELLKNLQKKLTSQLLNRKFSIDSRPFTPHITLGREITGSLWPFAAENIIIPVNRISLMQSLHVPAFPGKNKLVYTELFGYNLTRNESSAKIC